MSEYRRFVDQAQERFTQAARRWVKAQEDALAIACQLRDDLAESLPAPVEVMEANYELAERMLRLHKEATLGWWRDHGPRKGKPKGEAGAAV